MVGPCCWLPVARATYLGRPTARPRTVPASNQAVTRYKRRYSASSAAPTHLPKIETMTTREARTRTSAPMVNPTSRRNRPHLGLDGVPVGRSASEVPFLMGPNSWLACGPDICVVGIFMKPAWPEPIDQGEDRDVPSEA